MNILTYLGIFVFKIIEDALTTLRLIVVSNGKKVFGCILQFIATIIWIVLTATVLIDFKNDFWKIVAFSLGALTGSYCGSVIEEKIALGTNSYIIKTNKKISSLLANILISNNYYTIKINSNILISMSDRSKSKNIVNLIKRYDKNAVIIVNKIKSFN